MDGEPTGGRFERVERAYRVLMDGAARQRLDARLQAQRRLDRIVNEQLTLTDFRRDAGERRGCVGRRLWTSGTGSAAERARCEAEVAGVSRAENEERWQMDLTGGRLQLWNGFLESGECSVPKTILTGSNGGATRGNCTGSWSWRDS